ncbi:MAG: rod shape-determining protein RodA [Deltaproteobacteria bacterium]|nr:rod shape-determining protein RodA [Deltaproteobacteria bacterium]
MTEWSNLGTRSAISYRLLLVTFVICGIGIANIYSASLGQSFWIRQIFWVIFGFGVALVHLAFDYRVFERIAYPFYAFVVFLLMLVPLVGTKVYGARRWLRLAGFTLQPSELMKVAIIFVLARYFAEETRERSYTIRDLLRPLNVTRPLAAIAALIVLWGKNPWLQDPIGELARKVALSHNGVPPEWDGTYGFRVLLVTLLIAAAAIALSLELRPPAKASGFDVPSAWKQRLRTALTFGPVAVVAILTYVYWQSEIFGDPKSVILTWLVEAGAAGGTHEAFLPVLWFRVLLLALFVVYLAYAVWLLVKDGRPDLRQIVAPIDLVLVPMGLIMAQPDLGTALLVGAIAFSIILFVGMRWTSVALLAVSGVVLSVFAWFALLKDYQKRRVLTFIDPESDARGAGYHANQSMIAVGSGRFWGKGFTSGTQSQLSFLPEQHTDFAFSVWGEEHGFIGGIVLVTLYFTLIVIAVGIAARSRDRFGALLVTGFTALVFWQAFVNMGMVIGLLPVVGVPLPLFSYGGSSLLTVMVGLGITLNVAYRRSTFS